MFFHGIIDDSAEAQTDALAAAVTSLTALIDGIETGGGEVLPKITTDLTDTFDATHAGRLLLMSTNGVKTWTIPANATEPFPFGTDGDTATTMIMGVTNSTGVLTLVPAGGVTVTNIGDAGLVIQPNSIFRLIKINTNVWTLQVDTMDIDPPQQSQLIKLIGVSG